MSTEKGTAVAKVLTTFNTINAVYLSSPFVEKSSFSSFSFALLRKAINVLIVLIQIQPIQIFWILFCQISTLISQLKKLFMMLKVLLNTRDSHCEENHHRSHELSEILYRTSLREHYISSWVLFPEADAFSPGRKHFLFIHTLTAQ